MNDMYSEAILTTDASSFLACLFVNPPEILLKKCQVCWRVHLCTEWLVRLFVNPLLWSTSEITKMWVCWRVRLSTEWLVRLSVNPLFWSTTEITKMLVCWWVHLSTEWLAFKHLICIFWNQCYAFSESSVEELCQGQRSGRLTRSVAWFGWRSGPLAPWQWTGAWQDEDDPPCQLDPNVVEQVGKMIHRFTLPDALA
jgi:hypothetical protein